MRILKVGTRGEDVLLWQHFLMRLRATPVEGFTPPSIRMDGIFGRETRRATTAFQVRYRLRADGLVGRETFGKARELGLGKIPAGATGIGEFLRPLAPQLVAEPPPVAPPNEPRPAPPATTAPPSRNVTYARLRAEAWQSAAGMGASLTAGGAVFQLLKDGAGDYVYDEYSVVVDTMPQKKTPESFLLDLAMDLNGTIENDTFNGINVFKRRVKGPPVVGEIIDIDIQGPDNGSVALVELMPDHFVFQTVHTEEYGSHPENGGREFGFERQNEKIVFYTRGVSRPGNFLVRWFGARPQQKGWTSLMQGISDKIVKLGGKSNFGSFHMSKENRH